MVQFKQQISLIGAQQGGKRNTHTVEWRLVCDIIDQQYTHGSPVISYIRNNK